MPKITKEKQEYDKLYRAANRKKITKNVRDWYAKNPGKARTIRNKSRYGITDEDYNLLFTKQAGCCAVCGIHQSELRRKLDIDHCHKTKIVRGLLCNFCNKGLGLLKDDPLIITNLLSYLKSSDNGEK